MIDILIGSHKRCTTCIDSEALSDTFPQSRRTHHRFFFFVGITQLMTSYQDAEVELPRSESTPTLSVSMPILDDVFCKQVVRMCHSFELEVVSRRIFEEHSILLASLSLESKSRFNDKFDLVLFEPFHQRLPIGDRECETKVRYLYRSSVRQ